MIRYVRFTSPARFHLYVSPGPCFVLLVATGNDFADPDDRVPGHSATYVVNVKIDSFVGFAKSEHVS